MPMFRHVRALSSVAAALCSRQAPRWAPSMRIGVRRRRPTPGILSCVGSTRAGSSGVTNGIKWFDSRISVVRDGEMSFGGMELTVLGTSAGTALKHRGMSSYSLQLEGDRFLFDAGEGTQYQLAECAFRAPLTAIFVTHLHGDHIYGLPGLICSLAGFGLDLAEVPIYGPPGLRRFVDVALQAQTMATRSNSRFRIIELTTSLREQERIRMQNKHVDIPGGTLLPEEGETPMRWRVHETSQATVYAARLEHSVACFGYVVEEKSKPGTINEKLCISRGLLPGPSYRTLKEGGSVELPDGSVIHAKEVCSPPIPGRKVVVLGDTCGLGDMQSLAQDADLLVHECTVVENDRKRAMQIKHSTPQMAGTFARKVDAKKLVLTHFGGGFQTTSAKTADLANLGTTNDLTFPVVPDESLLQPCVETAQFAFGKKEVIAARDFMAIPVPAKPKQAFPEPDA